MQSSRLPLIPNEHYPMYIFNNLLGLESLDNVVVLEKVPDTILDESKKLFLSV